VRFIPAGHILGAAIVELNVRTSEGERRIVFSGDLGVQGGRLMGRPSPAPRPDYLIMESTYGNRSRNDNADRTEELFRIVSRTVSRGGKVIIPAFAVGRSQEIIARLNDLVEGGRLQHLPVFLDSPMAVRATEVFEDHPEAWSEEARALDEAGDAPLEFPGLRLTRSVDESKELNELEGPAVIISASGMCTAGRIKHHLKNNIGDPSNTVLFVGYQAGGTLGRIIQSGVNPVRIFGEMHTVKADIETIEGFSAHADRKELLEWFESLEGRPKKTFVVHGEEESCLAFGETLKERYGADVEVPEKGEIFTLD
jgi:metallo-beta-lactamase family protein